MTRPHSRPGHPTARQLRTRRWRPVAALVDDALEGRAWILEQLAGHARLEALAIAEDENEVRVDDRIDPVRNHENGAAGKDLS